MDRNNEASDNSPMIPEGMLPAYLAEAFGDLYGEDGLLCLARGLQCLSLMAAFCRFYGDVEEGHRALQEDVETGASPKKRSPVTRPPLVLVLGLRDSELTALDNILSSWGTPPSLLPVSITNESGQAKERAMLYQQGGVFCITSRILIVDMLSQVISADQIDGFLVAHAENVSEESTEGFILRIYYSQKQPIGSGFIKAFSDNPEALMSGFAKVDKTLKALHVRRLYLYPRFHDSVRQELESRPPILTELHQQLSTKQKDIQHAIAAAVTTVIRELKASTTLLEWNDSELSVENCVTTHFDRAISRQLEPEWHRLKPQTKQLVQDLRTLRALFHSLIMYDCVSFWKLLSSLKTMSAASRHPSLWLLTPAAELLFRKAKNRVYQIASPKNGKGQAYLQAILEENPKWKLLKNVLNEIQASEESSKGRCHVTVLVMVKDEKTIDTVKNYLVNGKSRTLLLKWLRYLENYNDRSRSITNNNGGTSALSEESRLLLEEEGRVRRILFGAASSKRNKRQEKLNQVPDYLRKRRRIAQEKGRGRMHQQAEDLERQAILDDAVEVAEHDLDTRTLERSKTNHHEVDEAFHVTNPDELHVVIRSYTSVDGDQASILLHDTNPKYIVLYDTDVAFIRAAEVYSALRPPELERARVYFLVFEASAEEKNFMKSLEREQNAFERLIHHKKTMPPPVIRTAATQEMQEAMDRGSASSSYMSGALPLAFDTRKGRGKLDTSKNRRDIAVDVREFRSALPSILHQGGMRLAPVTLTVGDFVLSNVHCIERKSISDLYGSFQSGRLYTQAEAMCRFYKCPCLLIEFDPSKSFCLQNANEIGGEIRMDSICSKMALLTMHFPKLRILWSRSPHETLRVFRLLKINHDEVDVDKAVEIGRNETVESLLHSSEDDKEDEVNDVARDMLLRLPGVTVHVARKIMQECDSLADLSAMSREELRAVAGPVTGQKLFTFFRQQMGSM